MTEETRECTKCKEVRPIHHFYKSADDREKVCIPCRWGEIQSDDWKKRIAILAAKDAKNIQTENHTKPVKPKEPVKPVEPVSPPDEVPEEPAPVEEPVKAKKASKASKKDAVAVNEDALCRVSDKVIEQKHDAKKPKQPTAPKKKPSKGGKKK